MSRDEAEKRGQEGLHYFLAREIFDNAEKRSFVM